MPIILDDQGAQQSLQAPVKIYSPKFFHSSLTGGGKNRGVLSTNLNPASFPQGIPMTIDNTMARRVKMTSGTVTTNIIPVNALTYDAWSRISVHERPDMALLHEIGLDPKTPANRIFVEMKPHSIIIEETDNSASGGTKGKKVIPCYQMFVYLIQDTSVTKHMKAPVAVFATAAKSGCGGNKFDFKFTTDPIETLNEISDALMAHGFVVHANQVQDFIAMYSIYDAMSRRSEEWQTSIDRSIDELFENILETYASSKLATDPATGVTRLTDRLNNVDLAIITAVLRHIDDYAVPLDLYRKIYDVIAARFVTADVTKLCRQNLNLLLSDTMESLNANKAQLNAVRVQNPTPPVMPNGMKYSPEQARAIASQEPLVLVQSGAGTGKAQPMNTPVLTDNGWSTMGALNLNDRVIGSDGQPHKILRIHERGVREGYELTFRDGSKTRACDEHVWTTEYVRDGEILRHDITTAQWVNEPCYRKYDFLPVMKPVDYGPFGKDNDSQQVIRPYLMGALLATAHLSDPRVKYRRPVDDNVHDYLIGMFMSEGFTVSRSHAENIFRVFHPDDKADASVLSHKLGMMYLKVVEEEKYVPEVYRYGSVRSRIEFINGVYDAIGSVRRDRHYASASFMSQRLARHVLEMLWSLGANATMHRVGTPVGPCWNVNVLDNMFNPFGISAQHDLHSGSVRPMRRSLLKAERIQPVRMRCIEIDAPDKLYVTSDYVLTHNSTVILGRIDWMVSNGIKPEDITVLSFTNAAADHIKEKNPNVHSMTIAHMIHTIYTANFQNHMLSELDTIANSLDIYFPNDDLAMKFKGKCLGIPSKKPNAWIDLNNFIEENYDAVIRIMDAIRQTSLELEIIICYQQIDHFIEPPEIQSKYLIIDEVQDNSVFEFIYALKYIDKHKESLFIVGDCSQTLYEFRASNPKAMNVLESSGVFATYQLQVNYRSNQEILDFANIVLRDIEANQFAQIQLQANSMAVVTEQTFTDKVKLKYGRLSKMAEVPDFIHQAVMSPDVKAYIDGCLARGEQVAFLAYKGQHVRCMEDVLKTMYPTRVIINMIPDRQDPTTILSQFIQKCWGNVKFMPTNNILQIVVQELKNSIPQMTRLKAASTGYTKFANLATRTVDKWATHYGIAVNEWQRQYLIGQLTMDQLMDNIKDSMLTYEIDNNKTKQHMMSSKNKALKEQNMNVRADFMLSTIHSAKGLEFDNVVLIYQDDTDMNEANKRMYYVALTRAMKSEFILAFNTIKNPRIKADYDTIVAQLHQNHPRNGLATPPTPVLTMDDIHAQAQTYINGLGPDPGQAPAQAGPAPITTDPVMNPGMAQGTAPVYPLNAPAQPQNAPQAAPAPGQVPAPMTPVNAPVRPPEPVMAPSMPQPAAPTPAPMTSAMPAPGPVTGTPPVKGVPLPAWMTANGAADPAQDVDADDAAAMDAPAPGSTKFILPPGYKFTAPDGSDATVGPKKRDE